MTPTPQRLRLEVPDERPCHDKVAREIVRQARKKALAYPTEAHDSQRRATRGLTYYPSIRKTNKETNR